MKTNVLIFLSSALMSKILLAQTCNDGFETNSFAGWQGGKGTRSTGYSFTLTSTSLSSPNFSVESASTSTIICSNSTSNPSVYQPLPAFGFGQYSARLGEYNVPGFVVEFMTYTFVPTVNDTNFLFAYSTYLQAPGHGPTDNPYFVVGILDANNDTIPGSFYMYQTGTPSVAGFDTSACGMGLYFKPWTIRGVNLSNYAGQTVTLFAVNADCAMGGHYAYSYLDMDCDGVLMVPATSNLILNATSEPNSTYLWNTGATTPTIMIPSPTPNSIYTCKVTLSSDYNNYSFYVIYKIVSPTSVENIAQSSYIKIYPNPANNELFVENIQSLTLKNTLGQEVKRMSFNTNQNILPVSDLPEGVYFVEGIDHNNQRFVQKLLIVR